MLFIGDHKSELLKDNVILNERMSSKNAKQMMLLARDHSLGPRPLRNLNQIAAAMANEKISFRDLQNIVLERVAEKSGKTGRFRSIPEKNVYSHIADAIAELCLGVQNRSRMITNLRMGREARAQAGGKVEYGGGYFRPAA